MSHHGLRAQLETFIADNKHAAPRAQSISTRAVQVNMSKKHIIQYYFVIFEQRDVASAELVIQSEKVNKYYSKAVDNSTRCGAKLCASIQ